VQWGWRYPFQGSLEMVIESELCNISTIITADFKTAVADKVTLLLQMHLHWRKSTAAETHLQVGCPRVPGTLQAAAKCIERRHAQKGIYKTITLSMDIGLQVVVAGTLSAIWLVVEKRSEKGKIKPQQTVYQKLIRRQAVDSAKICSIAYTLLAAQTFWVMALHNWLMSQIQRGKTLLGRGRPIKMLPPPFTTKLMVHEPKETATVEVGKNQTGFMWKDLFWRQISWYRKELLDDDVLREYKGTAVYWRGFQFLKALYFYFRVFLNSLQRRVACHNNGYEVYFLVLYESGSEEAFTSSLRTGEKNYWR